MARGCSQARGRIGAAAATAGLDLSHICNLHHSSQQRQILNPLSKTRDRTRVLMVTTWVHYHWAMMGAPRISLLSKLFRVPLFNTLFLDNQGLGLSWNNQFSLKFILSFSIERGEPTCVVEVLRRLGVTHLHCKMKCFARYEILLFNKKNPRLFILFHFIEFFLIQKLSMLVITNQTERKTGGRHLGPHRFPTYHHPVLRSVPAWLRPFTFFSVFLHTDLSAATDISPALLWVVSNCLSLKSGF